MATHSSVLAWRIPGTGERAAVYGVAQSRTQLKRLSSSSSRYNFNNTYYLNEYIQNVIISVYNQLENNPNEVFYIFFILNFELKKKLCKES